MLIPEIAELAPISPVRNTLTFTDGVRHRNDTVHGRLPVQTAHEIGKIVQDRQIVLDRDDIAVGGEQTANDARCLQTLLDIEVTRGLVEHVHVRALDTRHSDCEPLELSTR